MAEEGASSSGPPGRSLPRSPGPAGRPWVVVAANAYSGRRSNRRVVEQLVAALEAAGLGCVVLWQADHSRRVLGDRRWMAGCRAVVCAGGDGTLNHLVNCRPAAPLTVMPLGNENLFARHFGLSRQVGKMVEVITGGQVVHLDVAEAAGRRFVLMCSAGLDAEVVRRVEQWRRCGAGLRRVSRRSYVRPLLSAWAGYRYPAVSLEVEGRTIQGAHVFVFNLPCYGFGLRFAPQSRADDGLLDWVVFQRPGRAWSLRYAMQVIRNRHARQEHVQVGRAGSLRIAGAEAVPVQADGDWLGPAPVDISVLPGALPVLLPPQGGAGR